MKTGDGASRPWVRIPPLPPITSWCWQSNANFVLALAVDYWKQHMAVDAATAEAAAEVADSAGHMDPHSGSEDESGDKKPRQRRRGGRGRGRGAEQGEGNAAADQLVDAGSDGNEAKATSEDA